MGCLYSHTSRSRRDSGIGAPLQVVPMPEYQVKHKCGHVVTYQTGSDRPTEELAAARLRSFPLCAPCMNRKLLEWTVAGERHEARKRFWRKRGWKRNAGL
jgi:hypothetical protein